MSDAIQPASDDIDVILEHLNINGLALSALCIQKAHCRKMPGTRLPDEAVTVSDLFPREFRRCDIGSRFDARMIANMAGSTPLTTAEVDAFLNDLLVDAHDEEEQLTALEQEMSDALQSVVEVYVLGELMSLVGVSFDGNVRRGLVARCRRDDESEWRSPALVDTGVMLPQQQGDCFF